jgi:hypothetical protein
MLATFFLKKKHFFLRRDVSGRKRAIFFAEAGPLLGDAGPLF